jgi:hypothetical protein
VGWPVIICACRANPWKNPERTTRNGKQMIYEPCDKRVFGILADLIGHIAEPAADDDE